MDKFSTFEHDTLLSFLPFIEQKVNIGFRNDINSGILPEGIRWNPDMEALFIRAVNNFNKNLDVIKKNRPGALTSQQWDDLIFMFSSIENDVMNNPLIQPLFSNSAGKCHQILLSKRAERLVPFKNGELDQPTQALPVTAQMSADSLQDLKDKAFNRGLIAQVVAFIGLLAFVAVMLVNPRAYWSFAFLLIAAAALLVAMTHLRLARKIRHQIENVFSSAGTGGDIGDDPGVLPEIFRDSNARRFTEAVRDPDDYRLVSVSQNNSGESQAAGQSRAANDLDSSPDTRYLNASLLRYDLLGIGHCMKERITRNGCRLYLATCCHAFELVRKEIPEKKTQALATMIEKTTREVFTIALDQIEDRGRSKGMLLGETANYVHAFDLFLDLQQITGNPAYLRFITDRIGLINNRLAATGQVREMRDKTKVERIAAYADKAKSRLSGQSALE